MGLFGKKKKGASDETELEVMDRAENDKGDVKVKRKNVFAHFRKKFRLSLRKKASGSDDSGHTSPADSESGDDADNKKGKAKKPKKEKKPKEKKPKKPKKQKKKKSADEGNGDSPNKSKKKIVLIIISGSVLVATAAAFFVIKFIINAPTAEQRLLEAQLLFNDQKYAEADKIYEKLIKKDDTLVKAYLGRADVLVANGQADAAVTSLQEALEPTGDNPEIQKKIEELTPEPEPETGSATAPESAAFAVSFSDPAFEKMIRLAMNKSSSEQIMNTDLASVITLKIMGGTHAHATLRAAGDADRSIPSINRIDSYEIDGTVYTERGAIRNLNDLQHFSNLRKLIIGYNSITDISGISGLENIQTLGLYCNEIANLTPLSSLGSIQYLYIYNNRITDISALSKLTGLQQLWLNENSISDISPLKGLTSLTELFLSGNEIKDISAVASLKNLGFLYFDNNQVSDISAVKDLNSLTDVSFIDNPVGDASPASHVSNINRSFF